MLRATDVCRAKSEVYGVVACVDAPRNTPAARREKGLNPEFTGCPHCKKVERGEIALDAALAEARDFVARRPHTNAKERA